MIDLDRSALLVLVLAAPLVAGAEEVRLPVARDAWFCGVGAEADGSNGGSPKLKLKSYQEMSVVDVDPGPLRGRVVLGATLHVRSTGAPSLRRVTVGTIGSDWTEGTATNYAPEAGSSTFRHREHPGVPWTPGGGDLCDVILGQGGTTWRMADASTPDAEGWQAIPVDPVVVAARVAGISRGFLVFDDTGTEWTRQGNAFTVAPMPNRFVASRDSNRASAPYFTVRLGSADRDPPAAPTGLASEVADLPAGEAFASWVTPGDVGAAGTVGFLASVAGRELPRSLIPMAGRPGDRATIHLRDLGLGPGSTVPLAVRAIDGAGNVGPEARADVRVSARVAKPLPGADSPRPAGIDRDVRLGAATVAVVDELDKLDPTALALVPEQAGGYLRSNHLWDGGRIRLEGARDEFVGFQVLILGQAPGLRATLSFPARSKVRAEFGRLANVATDRGPMPDPVVPLAGPADFPGTGAGKPLRGGSIDVDLYVPRDAPAGEHAGELILEAAGGARAVLPVTLRVWDFALPDALSFLPELNAYGLPENERDFYRLAHRHRTALNRVPYSQTGRVAPGMAPKVAGDRFDWTEWDRRFGPYFDGSAFADLERSGVPLDLFYLPLHENWPTPIEGNYDGGYWADRAFQPSYRRAFVEASKRFAEHLDERGWRRTIFQGFLNNKRDFKAGGQGWAGGSSPWLLDEPASFQDFWALRYFASAFAEGVAGARAGRPGVAKLAFRADVSRPEWQRDSLDGLLDYNVVGGAFRDRTRLLLDRKRQEGQFALEYGTTNGVAESNVMAAAWCVDVWSLGLDGVIPWQTVGRAESWDRGDELALLYPGRKPGEGPSPSIRLKAFRRGQQDVEYLALLAKVEGEPRWAIGPKGRDALKLAGERTGAGVEAADAGSIRYDRLRPRDLWALRHRVGQALSDAKPAANPKPEGWRPKVRENRPKAGLAPAEGGMVSPRL